MKPVNSYIIIILLIFISIPLKGQLDEDPPVSPIFTFVTLDQISGRTEMTWSLSPSGDVAGYVVYLYHDSEGYAIDTIFDPAATGYSVLRPGTNYFSESYVIAAIDYSGNISPLSNELQTIHADSQIDTCNKKIKILWNKYLSEPIRVSGYDVFASVNSGTWYLAGHTSADITSFMIDEFTNESEYCFIVKAILENSRVSGSNKSCVAVKMQNPPNWINADYATVTADGNISLSFTIDTASEIDLFALERKKEYSGSFQQIAQVRTDIKSVTYTDKNAEHDVVSFYRLSAVNSCNIKVVSSNVASNIVLKVQNTGNEIVLEWTKYHDWLGSVSSYRIYMDTGNGFTESGVTGQADSIFTISIPDIMYLISKGKVCFYISASEGGNPYGIAGESNSNQTCYDFKEAITVPNIFTPDGDLKNDLFRPVLTFTPSAYHLVISNRQGKVLFETTDFMDTWDGYDNGNPVPEGVYLWFLKIKTSAGKNISRTGTLTVVKN
jgi:gliding motility-associated-like protein